MADHLSFELSASRLIGVNDDSAEAAQDRTQRDADVRDSLPSDLDPSAVVEPYLFPNNSRRRIPAVLYTLIGAACILARFTVGENTPVLNDSFVNRGRALSRPGGLGPLLR